ncbi:MAG: BlaI/MecI/CopY family transcriptional regulator, partial [Candidatus Diapherotrites archaeon]
MELGKINLEKDGVEALVGSLESDIMNYLWKHGSCCCKEMFESLGKKNGIAPTTVTVTCDRMYGKGLLERKVERGKGGLKYIYSPKISKDQMASKISK